MTNYLHGWVFTYNEYTNKWRAATRDNYHDLFSAAGNGNVISSSSHDTLVRLINKAKGDINKIHNFVS